MWREPAKIEEDIVSSDPARIADGLRDLREIMLNDPFETAPLDVAILKEFRDGVPEATALDFLHLLIDYDSFTPGIPPLEALRRGCEVALRYGTSYVALQAAMEVKISEDPEKAATHIVSWLAQLDGLSVQETENAVNILSNLLAGEPGIRSSTLRALAQWSKGTFRDQVFARLAPEFTEADRVSLL